MSSNNKQNKLIKKWREEKDNKIKDILFDNQVTTLNAINTIIYRENEVLNNGEITSDSMRIDSNQDSAFFFGRDQYGHWIGKKDDVDGHMVIFGRSGSGKTTNFAHTTLETWKGTIFAFDLKGDLISKAKKRKSKIIYLMPGHLNRYYFDPFYFIRDGCENDVIRICCALGYAIIPLSSNEKEPFWTDSARNILTAALVYFYHLGISFIHAMIGIKTTSISKLLSKISSDITASAYIYSELKKGEKTLISIGAVLQNYIVPFATDVVIQEALSSDDTNHSKKLIQWKDLEQQDIFIRVNLSDMDQFSGVIRLMLYQLIATLERRPEKYDPDGRNIKPTLLMFDEFPQYGKLKSITQSLKVLRSKNVTFALFCQSLADLDETYGEKTRRVILDNCAYKAILSADDPDTQKYCSDLVGTTNTRSDGFSSCFDEKGKPNGYSLNVSQTREPIIYPHEFASLTDIILIHPGKERFCRLEKNLSYLTKLETVENKKIFSKKKTSILKSLEERIIDSKNSIKDAEKRRKQEKHNSK